MKTFLEFFDHLSWLLQQEIETGDAADADTYRRLPKERGKQLYNSIIKELVRDNPEKFKEDYVHTFDSYTKKFKLPASIFKIISGQIRTTDDTWDLFSDRSDLQSAIRIVSPNTIINTGGWEQGDTLSLVVMTYPDDIINDYDAIDERFDGYIRLLELKMKAAVLSRKGEAVSELEIIELRKLETQWRKDNAKIKKKQFIAFRGHGFGRR